MSLNLFLNPIPLGSVKYVVSADFVDENGEAVPWEIRRLSARENNAIRRSCTRPVEIPGSPGVMVPVLMLREYVRKLAVACTAYPDLKDKDLQDSYHVMGEENLLRTMLSAGEYFSYLNKVQDVNGPEQTPLELQEQAKN